MAGTRHMARLRAYGPPVTVSGRHEAHNRVYSFRGCRRGLMLLEGQKGTMFTVRQAKLKPECADRYPSLPARMWTSATYLAELVASYRVARPKRPGKLDKER